MVKSLEKFLFILSYTYLFLIYPSTFAYTFNTNPKRLSSIYLAKKVSKLETSEGIKLGKGFGSPVNQPIRNTVNEDDKFVPNPMSYSRANNPNPNFKEDNIESNNQNNDSSSVKSKANGYLVKEPNEFEDADAVFKKYGIKNGNSNSDTYNPASKIKGSIGSGESRPFGEAVLARFPAATLAKIDSTLIFLAFGSLSLVILIGIGMSFNAFRVVFPNFSSNESIEYLITNVLTPSFTPTLLLFFLFSITYGLFKFAQVSSDSSVYKE